MLTHQSQLQSQQLEEASLVEESQQNFPNQLQVEAAVFLLVDQLPNYLKQLRTTFQR